jgi:plasmid stability protein
LHIVPISGIAPRARPSPPEALFAGKNSEFAVQFGNIVAFAPKRMHFASIPVTIGSAEAAMGINISIKNVPEEKVAQLKARAKRNHRSLQGEVLALIDQALAAAASEPKTMTVHELVEHGKRLGLRTGNDSVRWIREDRDSR